jgi:hypothetical protein
MRDRAFKETQKLSYDVEARRCPLSHGIFLACLALISWGIGPLILAFYSGPNAAGAYAVWGMLSVPVAVLSFTVGLLCRSALERAAARKAATEKSPVRRQSSVASSAVISRTSRPREKRPFRH